MATTRPRPPRRSVDVETRKLTRWGQGSGAKRKIFVYDDDQKTGELRFGGYTIPNMDADELAGLVDLLTHVQVELGLVDPPEIDE